MSEFRRAGRPPPSKIVAFAVVATVALWGWVLVSTVTVVVRLEPSVPLSLGMSSWSASADADATALAVASSQPWAVTDDESWLTVSPVSGTRSGTVQLVAAPNATSGARSATLTVTSAGTVRTLTVHQGALHPEGVLDLGVTDWDVGVGGGATVVDVTGAPVWTASADGTWVGVHADTDAGALTLTAAANTDAAPRSTLVTVTDGTTDILVTVNQAGQAEATLVLGAWRWSPGAGASELRVPVTSDQAWTVTSTRSWVSVAPTSGTGNGTITIRALRNAGTTSRTATVQVTGGGTTRTVRVLQAGAPKLALVQSPVAAPSPHASTVATVDAPVDPAVDPPVDPPVDPLVDPLDPPVGDEP